MDDLPIISICSICLKVNDPNWGDLIPGISDKIKKEMVVVANKVREERISRKTVMFSDTYCPLHMEALYKQYGMQGGNKKSNTPCLVLDTPEMEKVRNAYMKGIFIPEEIEKSSLVERFKKLAGISS